MAVCGIHNQHVHTGLYQQRSAFVRTFAHAYRRAHAQAAQLILARLRMFAGFEDILHRNQAAQLERIVHHQHTLDTVLMHQHTSLIAAGIFLDRNQPVARRHDIEDRLVEIGFKTQVAVGDNTDHLLAVHHGQAGNLVLACKVQIRRAPSCPARW